MKNILIAFVLLTFAACSSKTYPDTNWDGKQWTVVEILNVPVQTAGSREDAHLIFDSSEKMMSGNGGCNRIFGSYEIEKKNSLRFGEIGATRMACQDSPFENKFLEVLKSVRYYQVNAGELLLKNGDKKVILKLQ
ncbi:META domain-containing protein [Algoriphagus sp.]|uniref:META domain-containing protein n=1 Tax=Algoriphagus sp. TaxID=1872435 RepID=UPI0032703232